MIMKKNIGTRWILGLSFLALCCCSAEKKVAQSGLSIEDIKPGRTETAVLGTIQSIKKVGDSIELTVLVESSKQGGPSAGVLVKNTEQTIILRPLSIQKYERSGDVLSDDLKVGKKILATVRMLPGSDNYETNNIILN